jgi:hypothetical protein
MVCVIQQGLLCPRKFSSCILNGLLLFAALQEVWDLRSHLPQWKAMQCVCRRYKAPASQEATCGSCQTQQQQELCRSHMYGRYL